MNEVTLLGIVVRPPVYHCTEKAQDILRIQLSTRDRKGKKHIHHCLAFGQGALDLHSYLSAGNRLMVRGELLYKSIMLAGKQVQRPYVLVRAFTFLDRIKRGKSEPAPNPSPRQADAKRARVSASPY